MLHWKCVHVWRKAQRCEEITKGHDGQNIKDSLCCQPIPVVLVLMFENTDKLSVILHRSKHTFVHLNGIYPYIQPLTNLFDLP